MGTKKKLFVSLISAGIITLFIPVYSQSDTGSKLIAGADFYSSYIWRGTKYGNGPVVQPSVRYSGEKFTAGAWGSFDFSGFQEADLFLSFSVTPWLSFGLTDYYYSNLPYNDFTEESGSHAYEINAGFSKWNISLSANYILNKADGIGSNGGDKYFEAGYAINSFKVFIGAGDGWHTAESGTVEDRFAVCNIGIGINRNIRITETFSIPVTGQVIFNPDRNQMFLVAGFSIFP